MSLNSEPWFGVLIYLYKPDFLSFEEKFEVTFMSFLTFLEIRRIFFLNFNFCENYHLWSLEVSKDWYKSNENRKWMCFISKVRCFQKYFIFRLPHRVAHRAAALRRESTSSKTWCLRKPWQVNRQPKGPNRIRLDFPSQSVAKENWEIAHFYV